MRKITEDSVAAFNNGFTFSKQNMQVTRSYGLVAELPQFTDNGNITKLKLHGNTIAIKFETKKGKTHLFITNAGWESNTTKERLNALDGVSIVQRNFIWYLNDEEWDGSLTEI